MFIIAQIVGLILVIVSVIGLQQKEGESFLFYQIIISVLYVIQYLLLGAITGAIISIIAIIRCIVFWKYKKENKKTPVKVLILFVLLSTIASIITSTNIYGYVLTIGTVVFTYALWQDNMKTMRALSLISVTTYIIYNIIFRAYTSIIIDLINLFTLVITILKNDIKILKSYKQFISRKD